LDIKKIITMKILIVSATEKESNLVLQKMASIRKIGQWLSSSIFGKLEVHFLVSGVGLPSTIYRLTSLLVNEKYDLLLNVGIAGSYNNVFKIGDVVNVTSEQFGDIGVNDNGTFRTMFDMGYIDQDSNPYSKSLLINSTKNIYCNSLSTLPSVKGLTVNNASGELVDISMKKVKFESDIETMEGAGVFYTCLIQGTPFFEIRAISNMVEARNPKKWNTPLALINLSATITQILVELDNK
jgi:futalosine hydrolase